MRRLNGIPASSGIVIGKILKWETEDVPVSQENTTDPVREVERFREAVHNAEQEVKAIRENVRQNQGETEAKIFEAQLLMLQDEEWLHAVERKMETSKLNAVRALDEVTRYYLSFFDAMADPYMKERKADIQDVSRRMTGHLLGRKASAHADGEPRVVVAHDLTPSETAQFGTGQVLGFAAEVGGKTSHAAIMARSMEIPAVVGLNQIMASVEEESTVILDGYRGDVIVDPTQEVLTVYEREQTEEKMQKKRRALWKNCPTRTMDGEPFELMANIGMPDELAAAVRNGADGIGLFRTESLFMSREQLPDEEEQFSVYKQAAQKMRGKPVILRTLDIGGDKDLPYFQLPEEMNPFLGFRAIRLCLQHQAMFKSQLRAMVRASAFGHVKIMYPMIGTVEEVRDANRLLREVKGELEAEGIAYDRNLEVGMMVEVPAAAAAPETFVGEVDFFSVGTNDLIQYTMAADRMNENVSHLYQPYHPGVLRLIHRVAEVGHRHGIPTGMCGEAAADPLLAPIWIGMGLNELSMSASSILPIKERIGHLEMKHLRSLARQVLDQKSSEAVHAFLQREFE